MKIGDVVKLKVDGPKMSIDSIMGGIANCSWFDGAFLNRGNFNLLNLILSETPTNGRTHVFQIMDGSGSMGGIWDEINGMMTKQFKVHADAARDGQDIRVTSFVFDDMVYPPSITNQDPTNIEFPKFTFPGGMTALHDAIGAAIKMARAAFKDEPNEAVLVQIYTDGLNNRSVEWTRETINAEITRLQATGKWTFQFIGANQQAEETARDLGIFTTNAIRFKPTGCGVASMTKGMVGTTEAYYGARAAGAQSVNDCFGEGDDKVFDDIPEAGTAKDE